MASITKEELRFDFLIIGTDLQLSIIASTLAIKGKRVLHIDALPWYGGYRDGLFPIPNDVNFGLVEGQSEFSRFSEKGRRPDHQGSAGFQIELSPFLLPTVSDLVTLIAKSRLSESLEYSLVAGIYFGEVPLPLKKEDVFESGRLGLVGKRKVMRTLNALNGQVRPGEKARNSGGTLQKPAEEAKEGSDQGLSDAGVVGERSEVRLPENTDEQTRFSVWLTEQELPEPYDQMLGALFAISFPQVPVKDVLMPQALRLWRHIRLNVERFAATTSKPSPYLAGMYGCGSEMVQAFCRTCAVHGGWYMLGTQLRNLEFDSRDRSWHVDILGPANDDVHGDPLPGSSHLSISAKRICRSTVVSERCVRSSWIARAVLLTDSPLHASDSKAVLNMCLKSETPEHGDLQVIQFGSALGLAPPGKYVIHVRANVTARKGTPEELLLRPLQGHFEFANPQSSGSKPHVEYALFYRQNTFDNCRDVLRAIKSDAREVFVPPLEPELVISDLILRQACEAVSNMLGEYLDVDGLIDLFCAGL